MHLINPRAIIWTIPPIIAFMKDEKRELRQKNINTLAFIAAAIKADPNI